MSAGYVVDLGNTTVFIPSQAGGSLFPGSGANIGNIVDLLNCDTYTNLVIGTISQFTSGQLRIAVQTSDLTTSGTFTDPMSGFTTFPSVFASGGIVFLNSGGGANGGTFGPGVSGQFVQSGVFAVAGFQRPHRYVRSIAISGDLGRWDSTVGFLGQQHTTGSGGGVTFQPTSGVVNV